jgi:uncharacterized protein YjgD (DUF1641 family)
MAMAGVVEEPLSARHELMARLERPDTLEALNRLLDRLDVMVLAADAANGFLERAEVIADSVSESLSELRKIPLSPDARQLAGKLPQLTHAGLQAVDLVANPAFERLLSSGLLERLGDPKTIDAMHTLLDQLDLASFALTSVNEFLKRSEVIADSVAESIHEVTRGMPKVDFAKIKETAESLPMLLDVALEVKRSGLLDHAKSLVDTLDRLQESGTLAPDTVDIVGGLGAAATSAHKKQDYRQYAPKGVFGLLGALKDPNVQATLGFAIAFAHNYGQTLRREQK